MYKDNKVASATTKKLNMKCEASLPLERFDVSQISFDVLNQETYALIIFI